MSNPLHQYIISILLCLLFASPVHSNDMDIRDLMRTLLHNMQQVQEGLLIDDYPKIATNAEAIIYHRGPSPDARLAISNELGMEARTFQILNDNVRRKARLLKRAAEKFDQEASLDAYTELTEACTNCHNAYRKRLRRLK